MKRLPFLLAFLLAVGLGYLVLGQMSGYSDPRAPPEPGNTAEQAPGLGANGSDVSWNNEKPTTPLAPDRLPIGGRKASVWDQLRDGDFWNLMSEHWPRANDGVPDSQLIVHSIMSSCVKYRKRFEGKHLAEVQAEFSSFDDPNLFILNAQVWDRCGKLYESWARFDGWKGMREAAAYNGQPVAMVWKGGTLVSNPETFREGIRWLESAIASGDGSAVAMMSEVYSRAYVDRNLEAAWVLAACKLGVNCSLPAESCGEFFTACGIQEPIRDAIVRELGDGGYYIADQQSARIYEAIASGNVESLNIAADLRK
jgi:hypothetical protein